MAWGQAARRGRGKGGMARGQAGPESTGRPDCARVGPSLATRTSHARDAGPRWRGASAGRPTVGRLCVGAGISLVLVLGGCWCRCDGSLPPRWVVAGAGWAGLRSIARHTLHTQGERQHDLGGEGAEERVPAPRARHRAVVTMTNHITAAANTISNTAAMRTRRRARTTPEILYTDVFGTESFVVKTT